MMNDYILLLSSINLEALKEILGLGLSQRMSDKRSFLTILPDVSMTINKQVLDTTSQPLFHLPFSCFIFSSRLLPRTDQRPHPPVLSWGPLLVPQPKVVVAEGKGIWGFSEEVWSDTNKFPGLGDLGEGHVKVWGGVVAGLKEFLQASPTLWALPHLLPAHQPLHSRCRPDSLNATLPLIYSWLKEAGTEICWHSAWALVCVFLTRTVCTLFSQLSFYRKQSCVDR